MLFVLSPAKTLDYITPVKAVNARRATEPLFTGRAAELIARLAPLSPPEVAGLMELSDELAALNVGRYALWQPEHTPANSRPAVLTFNGDVYEGLQATTLSTAQLDWAQQHIVILSGLYGALRPLDRLQPYRLEMGTRLANDRGADLYAFWGDTIADYLNQRAAEDAGAGRRPAIINLASQEYFRAAHRKVLAPRVVECVFEDWKAGQYKVISFFAKRARGLMARWAIERKPGSVKALEAFDREGYAFDRAASSADRLVFRRRVAE